jgi:hypothetical protein
MDLLKAGQKLSILFQKEDSLVEIACVISALLEDRIVIDLPQYFMRYIEYLDVGCSLTIKAFSKIGTVDFNTIVITSPLEDEFSVELDYNAMKLTPNDEIPVVDAVETLNITMGEKFFKVSTFEIATEYLKFYCDYEFKLDDTFDCELILPKKCGIIRFKGTVTYIDPVYDNEYQISYSNMLDEDRQTLLYYMYLYSNSSD